MASCPSCKRPIAIPGRRCLYCGAALEAQERKTLEEGAQTSALCLVADLKGASAKGLAEALSIQTFNAEQQVLRGGMTLVLVGERVEAEDGAARLERAGIRAVVVPEEEVRKAARPVFAYRGSFSAKGASLRGPEGTLELPVSDLFLVVRGPIARARQTAEKEWRRIEGSPLEAGMRIHLHRLRDLRPVEIDPFDLDLGKPPLTGSVLLEINEWITALPHGIPEDTGFRYEGPALAPEAPPEGGFGSMAGALAKGRKRGGKDSLVLDNTAQFRFYSAWRGLAQRRLRTG